jgi:hypothetical protein
MPRWQRYRGTDEQATAALPSRHMRNDRCQPLRAGPEIIAHGRPLAAS